MATTKSAEKVVTGFNRERQTIKNNLYSKEGAYEVNYKYASADMRACVPSPAEFFAKNEVGKKWQKERNAYFAACKEADAKRKTPTGKVTFNTAYLFIWKTFVKATAAKEMTEANKDEWDAIKGAIRAIRAEKAGK